MTELERAMEQLREMGTMGWRFRVEFSHDGGVDDISGSAGDCNCPHRKQYDPNDGHGFSAFDCTQDYQKHPDGEYRAGPIAAEWFSLSGEDSAPFPQAIDFAYRHVKAIVPGEIIKPL